MNNVKKKYTATVLGSSFTSLLCSSIMTKHGAKILLIDKASSLGGRVVPFIKNIEGEKYYFNNDFLGFSGDTYSYKKIFLNELEIDEKIKKLYPKIKLTIINKKENIVLLNDTNKYHSLINSYPLNKKNLKKFIEVLNKVLNNSLLISDYSNKYNSAYDLLKKYFKDNLINDVFGSYAFFFALELKKIDAGYFLLTLINYFISKIYYPYGGITPIINYIIREITNNKGNFSTNTKIKSGVISKNKLVSFKATTNNNIKQNIKSSKFLIGMNYIDFLNNNLKLNNHYLKNYKKIFIDNLSSKTKLKLYIIFNKEFDIKKYMNSYQYLINEKNNDLINNYSLECENSVIKITNYSLIKLADKKISNYISAEIIVSKNKVNDIKNNKKNIQNYYDYVINITSNRIYKIFPEIKKYVKTIFIKDILSEDSKHKLYDLSYNGINHNKINGINERSILTPFSNSYIASMYSCPGGDIMNAFNTAYRIYHLFDINYKGHKYSNLDILNYEEYFNILAKKYKYVKKYNHIVIGFYFDHESSFLIQFTKEKLLVKKSTFEEAFAADIYLYTNFAVWKNIFQRRSYLTFEVIANRVRVKGGVWLLKRIFKRAKMYYIDEKDIKILNKNFEKIMPTNKLLEELSKQ